MSALDDPRSLGPARLSFADAGEVALFVETLGRFERGELSAEDWRAFRVLHGNYEQRQDDVQMVRVKIPQGILDARQLDAIADVSERHARGFAHVTTRQNVQLHFVKAGEVPAVFGRLAEAGLTTREACGNTVRNVTTCPFAGVSATEAFDPTPYAEALTRHFLRVPLFASLPRKVKIAFEGCAEDHALTAINDLGFRAAIENGRRGFRITAGGGTGILPTPARTLWDFVPAGEILDATEAVLRVFHRLGERKERTKARLKWLVRSLGWEAFAARVNEEREVLRAAGGVGFPFDPENPPASPGGAPPVGDPVPPPALAESARAARGETKGPGLLPVASREGADSLGAFAATNVRPQSQSGWVYVLVHLPLGDVTGSQLRHLGRLARAYGDGTVRTTHRQDLLLRWVRAERVRELHLHLAAAGLARPGAETIADVTSCPGAESCRLAVTHSRGLGNLLAGHLAARPSVAALAPDLAIRVSGCPNGCGQHHVSGLGFQGSVRQVDGRPLSQYFLTVGGGVDAGGVHFGKTAAKIPARRVPQAVERLLRIYAAERDRDESAEAFFRRIGAAGLKPRLADLETLSPADATSEDFLDLGQEAPNAAPGELEAVAAVAFTPRD